MDKERILIATTDGHSIYHHISIIQSDDGSFYCNLGDQPGRKEDHASYHASGEVHFYFGNKLIENMQLPPPTELKHVSTFPQFQPI